MSLARRPLPTATPVAAGRSGRDPLGGRSVGSAAPDGPSDVRAVAMPWGDGETVDNIRPTPDRQGVADIRGADLGPADSTDAEKDHPSCPGMFSITLDIDPGRYAVPGIPNTVSEVDGERGHHRRVHHTAAARPTTHRPPSRRRRSHRPTGRRSTDSLTRR